MVATAPTSTATGARYRAVRSATEALAEPLSAEDQTVQSMADVSPTKWHRAHVTWFFETFLLAEHVPGYRPFHPMFGYLFNSYYEALGARHPRPDRGLLSRPSVEEVAAYRRHVDEAMGELFGGDLEGEIGERVELGLNHEQQHQELLLMDIKHVLSQNPLRPAYAPAVPAPTPTAPPPGWLAHPGGLVEVGEEAACFTFDNERPRHLVQLAPFALCSRPVLCGEWLEFIADGGYERPELWLSDGWAAVTAEGRRGPLYWSAADGGAVVFTLTGERPVDPAEPVCHVSYYEADAFARWSGARLPTEVEWEAVARAEGFASAPRAAAALHPAAPSSPGGAGEVWEWTSSAYLPYPGFRVAPGAVGEYNGKFMVNQHVLRGGCCATPPGHERLTYRNFFPPGARWAFCGLRLARDC
ncbi:MAG TPA: ergothioneine biosynthesis protein EgtB [Acidimicrobiales bacterium]|nr:ergothioneine biosynthesis protein EgtB [Acidimicrobiales bacterium]